MAIFRGVGGSGDSSDNSFLDAVTAQANSASASASAASASAVLAQASANSILTLTAATGDAGTDVSYNASTGVLTVPKGADGTDASVTAANVTGVLTGGTGISIASNGTITNDSPDQTVALTGTGATTITGTYPNFTIDSTNTTYTVGDGGLTTNDFTDADHSKLDGIEANATADQTGSEIKSAYEAVADTNAFTDAEKTKLSGIEANADVTDTTNVTSAGAAMLASSPTFTGTITVPNVTVSGTVDGRDVATDGSKLDTLLYHRVSELRLAGNTSAGSYLYLNTVDQNLGQATNIYHPSTPDDTTRLVDVEWTTYWGYTSVQNDTRLTLHLTVPVGGTTQNLGTVTEVSQYDPNYSSRGSGQKWYYVSGNVAHHFTPFGRMSQSSSGSLKHTIVSSQYDPSTNRTYFCLKIATANMVTNDTAYWHPYAWESNYTTLTQSYDITERYRSGLDRNKVSFKLPFTDATLTFRLKIKELASGDNAQVADSVVRLTSMGV